MPKKKKLRINRLLMMLLPMFLLGSVLFTLYEQQKEMAELKKQEAFYIDKIKNTEKEIQSIIHKIENAHNDEYIEKIAREQLKMIGEDEIIFIDIENAGN
ncbi:hypothetical protein F8154_12320 [Alkaliphilus pronyensis]|uniref:Septum formation initiator family protein n=1 Tax=Alkaliphilus pronyensis TaxID=1482732 RepID=A0A6I0F2I9_9FIRM|nr:septum formation initiator family protein [Alkaliphilus pronyensis]KAB3531889.1 hypothetical protein F8154_12320 [Alkaliphilus pronyensis]